MTCGICVSVCGCVAVGVSSAAQAARNEEAVNAPPSFRKSRRDILERIGEVIGYSYKR
jgi:hypothetical protein